MVNSTTLLKEQVGKFIFLKNGAGICALSFNVFVSEKKGDLVRLFLSHLIVRSETCRANIRDEQTHSLTHFVYLVGLHMYYQCIMFTNCSFLLRAVYGTGQLSSLE